MATMISLTTQPRGAGVTARALRRAQIVPGVIYGHGFETRSLQFDHLSLVRVIGQAGTSRLVSLMIEGEDDSHTVLIREVQRDPVTSRIMHVDLYRILADETVRSVIPLVQRGDAPAASLEGMVSQLLDAIEVECLPKDMPEAVEIDLSKLTDIGSHITVAELSIPEGIQVLTPPHTQVARVLALRREPVEEEVVEVELAEEGGVEAAAEGEIPEERTEP